MATLAVDTPNLKYELSNRSLGEMCKLCSVVNSTKQKKAKAPRMERAINVKDGNCRQHLDSTCLKYDKTSLY